MENLSCAAEMEASSKQDRISDLPDAIIQHILSFLPTTEEAVRAGVLSKRWRRQWTHLPLLIFEPLRSNYLRFIEDTLALHECPNITGFHLRYDKFSDRDPQFASKVHFAVTKCVQDLSVVNHSRFGPHLLPKSVIESKSLVRLVLHNCYIKPDWTVNLPSLKSLRIHISWSSEYDEEVDDGGIDFENFISGCPLLESLELSGYPDDPVAVVSTSLKVFCVSRAQFRRDLIKVACPNLVEFNMKSSYIHDQMIENVLLGCPCIHSLKIDACRGLLMTGLVITSNSLKVLHLESVSNAAISVSCPNLVKADMLCCTSSYFKTVNLPSTVCATIDLIDWGDPYLEFVDPYIELELLEQFQHLSTLTIQSSLLLFISSLDMEGRPTLPSLKNKMITLYINISIGFAIPGIALALGSPKLETLVVKLDSQDNEEMRKCYRDILSARLDYWNSERSPTFACLESHLKTVEIIGLYEADHNCQLGLELIEFLLKKARVLKKMKVSLEKSSKDFVIEFSRKLESFPKYSQCANVELLCST